MYSLTFAALQCSEYRLADLPIWFDSGTIAEMSRNGQFTTFALLAASIVLLGADAPAPAIPDFAKQLPAFKSGAPVFAFNGRDLEGWYTYLHNEKYEDPNEVFTIQDGLLCISGQGMGGITTKQTFKDYHLVTEWKWGQRTWDLLDQGKLTRRANNARDSGILVHGVGADDAAYGHWLESIEVQIIEGGVGDFIVVGGKNAPSLTVETRGEDKALYFEPGGKPIVKRGGRINWWGRDPDWKDTLGYRGPRDVEAPHGQWNRLEVVCDGDRISTILNGYLVNAGIDSSHTEGKIQLQSEGAEILFRKIEIRPLTK
jgi:hypothetical protein